MKEPEPLWCVLDLETTGLEPATASVWQLGASLWQGGVEVAALELFVQPLPAHFTEAERHAARVRSALTRAEETMLERAPPLGVALGILGNTVQVLRLGPAEGNVVPDVLLTSWNRGFERKFLDPWPLSTLQTSGWRWAPCLMQTAARHAGRTTDRLSLQTACEAWNVTPTGGAHRALSDARMAAAVGRQLGMLGETGPLEPPLVPELEEA